MRTPGDGPGAAFRRACFKNFIVEIILIIPGGEGGQVGPLVADALRFSFGTPVEEKTGNGLGAVTRRVNYRQAREPCSLAPL
jgi:hypothetical protein